MTGRICGTGSCVPSFAMDNNDIAKLVDTSDEWIRERTGVVRRHIIREETTVSMAAEAGRQALENAGIAAQWPAAGGGAAALQLCGAPPACGAHGDCADLRLFLQPCMVGAGPVPVLFGIWLWSEPLCHRQLHQCGV